MRFELPVSQIVDDRVCVAERDGTVVGFSVVLPRTDGDAELHGLFVDPAARRNGIGKRLVCEAGRRAALEGANALRVTANPSLSRFISLATSNLRV
jgi:ribosomal protein S18 acetylase RimI-like enzyme